MRTNLNKTNLTLRNSLSLPTLRAVLMVLLIAFGMGNAWGNSSTNYYTKLKVAKGTGNGCVYAATTNSSQPGWQNADMTLDKVTTASSGSDTYYVWASALRGSVFTGWDKTVSGSSNPYTFSITRSTSESTTTLTAKWTTYTAVNVTYNPSSDGAYSVTYQYNSYNSSTKTITTGDAEGLSRTITAANGAQTLTAYHNDVITLKSESGDFQGWYSNEACTTELTGITNNGDGTYTFVVPASGTTTMSVYAKYPHVDHYYGRLTASIAVVPYSMPGGGMIFVSNESAATGPYSENAQSVDNESMGTKSQTYYLHAQPTDKRYVFRGWYSNAQCTGTPLSTNKDYTYTVTASSTNSASPTTGNIYAAFDFNLYYLTVDAQPAAQGLGMVLVREENTGTPEYGEYSNESSLFAYVYRGTPTKNVYLYAKPKYGYKFSGWYANPECTGAAIGTANPYAYAATGSSTDPMNPDTTWLYAKFVPATDEEKISITYNIPDKSKGEYTASVLDIEEVDDEYVWTFTEVYNSADYTADKTLSQHKTDVLRLEAVCKAEYGVTSWSIAGSTKTTPSQLYETSATATEKAYGVTFGDAKPFMVCSSTSATSGTQYATLREALDNLGSNKMIRVVQNAYVPAGDYTIPDGVRLYVLRADASASKGKSVERSQAAVTAPTPYVTLTLGQGANIIVNGSGNIEVGAQIVGKAQDNSGTGAGCNGAISGTYGLIVMSEGSTITLNGSSVLYAWGQIIGEGRITANSGTTVYEIFQVTDWCGGSRAYACNDGASTYKMFPFSQYHIQNIEVPLRLKNGAYEKLMAVIDGNTVDDIPLVGPNSTSSMFRMNSNDAYIEKSYDKVNDRQVYRTGGKASISDFSMKVVITVSTSSFILPLTNNMSVYIESGTTSITTNAIMNADARVYIAEGATLEMASGKSLYVYDSDDWLSGFVFSNKKIAPIRYSLPYATTNGTSSGTPIRTSVDDAVILVNGTLDMKGKLYTSSGNAKIYSTATGKVKFTNAVTDANETVYHLNTISGSNILASVATTYNTTMYPAKLRNGDGSFIGTAGAAANDQFIYNKNMEQWMKNPKTVTWNANGGTTEVGSTAHSDGSFLGELPAAYKEGYTLDGWFTAASGGTQISQTTKVTANVEYFAHWTPKQYNITYMDQGKAAFSSTHIDSPNAHPTKHTYGTTTTLNGVNNKTGYDFGGWHTISNCKAESWVTSLSATGYSKDITLYAKWTPQEYAITYKDKGGADFSGTSWSSTQPTKHTYGTATTLVNPSKANYTFGGWYTTSACTGSAVTSLGATAYTNGPITLYAKWNETTHTVSVAAGANGSVSPESVSGVGVATASDYITATPNTGYSFSGWTLPESGVTAASGYTTSSNPIQINATADGKTITANFAVDNYNVTYTAPSNGSYTIKVADAAAVSASTTAQYNQTVVLSATPADGYKFDHWTVTKANSSTVTVSNNQFTMPAEAVTISATFSQNNFDVTFDMQGHGTAPDAQSVAANGKVAEPSAPSVSGYTFDGWYKEPACTNAWNFSSDVVTANTTLYAQWTPNENTKYTVEHYKQNLEDDGYSLAETTNEVGTTDEYTMSSPMSYTGFEAEAWEEKKIAADGSTVVEIYYNRKTYTVTWVDPQGWQEIDHESYKYGATPSHSTYDKPSDASYSYEFLGWSWTKGASWEAGSTVEGDPFPVVTGDITFRAVYNALPLTMVVTDDRTITTSVSLNSTTVRVSGHLSIAPGAKLTTTDLVIEASKGASGEITGNIEDVTATNVYFDYAVESDGRHWNVFGVPFEIGDLDAVKLQYKNARESSWHPMILGTHYDITYYDEATRAAQGPVHDCWKYVEDKPAGQRTLQPGIAYSIAFLNHIDTLRFTKASGSPIEYVSDVEMTNTNTGDGSNGGWNGIANPKTYHALLATGVTLVQIHDGGEIGKDSYDPWPIANYKFVVGRAGYVQIDAASSVLEVATAGGQDPIPTAHIAARRTAAEASELYTVEFNAEGTQTDRVYVRTEDDKSDEYTVGSDVMKMSTSSVRPQIWVNRFDMKLCMNTVAPISGQAAYPLGLYAPAAGEYTLALKPTEEDANTIYLTCDGVVIWNLTYSPYVVQLEKGTNTRYGLQIVHTEAPAVTTGVGEAQAGTQPTAQKVLLNDKVYILRGTNVYTVEGQMVK